ncbi:hypothetical protein D3Y57_07095 [Sphingomonas paeninsulae]|uniref:Uncharacterized protein n=1 Tax=Sphingomonas paeninsulae TaxID=2319844 RepID=A0A494TEP6_SPHPE|nr:hypothetical protein [Sphingomonas paeninsulae]AYJ85784.1 hypothetical protein D3Y57_07095 [Sphingomonas paeninsulae]
MTTLETRLEECKERDAEKDDKLSALGLCLRLLIPEVQRLDPTNTMLSQVRMLLAQSFPVEVDLPHDMADLLRRIM